MYACGGGLLEAPINAQHLFLLPAAAEIHEGVVGKKTLDTDDVKHWTVFKLTLW